MPIIPSLLSTPQGPSTPTPEADPSARSPRADRSHRPVLGPGPARSDHRVRSPHPVPPPRPTDAGWLIPPVVLLATLLLIGTPPGLTAQERPLTPEDSYRMVNVGSPALSPDGRHLAFTATTIREEENDRRTSIWMQKLEDGEPVGEPIRFTDPTRDASSPRWSPDGSLLSFTSRRSEEDQTVWFLRVGAVGGEAFTIEGVEGPPIWSRDGEQIAFLKSPERDDEAEGAGTLAPDAISRTLDLDRFDGHVVTNRRYKRDGQRDWLPHPELRPRNQLFVVPAQGGEARQLTDLPRTVGNVEWAPDGQGLYFTADPMEDDEMHFHPSSRIYYLPLAGDGTGGEPELVLDAEGGFTSPAVSPDGERLAFLHTPSWFDQTELMVVRLGPDGTAEGAPRNLTQDWIYSPGAPSWSADGAQLRFQAGVHGNTHLFRVALEGGAVQAVTEGDRTISGVSVSHDDEFMAYVSSDPVRPGETHVARLDGSGEVRISDFNDDWLKEVAIQPATPVRWTVSDGTEVEGWVIPPAGAEAGTSHPMILSIHGGPHSAYRNTFMGLFQVLSGAGFYVFYPNPRGSTTYGNDFKHAIHAGWGLVDEEDFVTGVEAVLAAHPDIDPERLGVTGGSYGGYMSNWLTARTDLFAAAVTRASISHWESLAKTTDSSLPHLPFDGASFEQRELFRALSPISYVENVTAPTLVIHGEMDYRTPLGEGEQWYGALQKLGVPSEFVLYPRSAHGIREPWLAADSQERTLSWFEHWLLEVPRAAEEEAEATGAADRFP